MNLVLSGFGLGNSAVAIPAKVRRLSSWRSEDGVAAAPPMSSVRSELPEENIVVVPYGAARTADHCVSGVNGLT
jgi:hypothetical protein